MGKTTDPPKRMTPGQLVDWCYREAGLDLFNWPEMPEGHMSRYWKKLIDREKKNVAGFAEAMKAGAQVPATERYQVRIVEMEPQGSDCFNVEGATLFQVMRIFLSPSGRPLAEIVVRIR